jgi:hypothetical protein
MTGEPGAEGTPAEQDLFGLEGDEKEAALDWMGEHITEVRESASGQRFFYWILGLAFVLGLAAHAGGFLLKSSFTTEPGALLADLLYALGWAMWTGVVVVMFVEILPEVKRRQYQRFLEAYEAATGRRGRPGRGEHPNERR